MVKRTLIYFLVGIQLNAFAAMGPAKSALSNDFPGYDGLLRFQGTFSMGYNTAFKSVNYFIHGDLEYYFEKKWSVRSDGYFFLNSRTPNDAVEPFRYQHSLLTGMQYHLLEGKLDWYMGLQPGLVFGQRQYAQITALDGTVHPLQEPQKTIAAVFSANTGINYYANRFFHLFMHIRYNAGWFSDNYSVASLNEFRASFGLGFFISTKRGQKTGLTGE